MWEIDTVTSGRREEGTPESEGKDLWVEEARPQQVGDQEGGGQAMWRGKGFTSQAAAFGVLSCYATSGLRRTLRTIYLHKWYFKNLW